jgi:hypothetical protein
MQKAKKEAAENKPKVTEQGGFKCAPLQSTEKGREQEYVFSKKTETPSLIGSIPLPVKDVVFTNSSLNNNANFAPLEKTAQQLKEEELEQRMKKEPVPEVKGAKGGWLGSKANEVKAPEAEFKVSAWAIKAQESQGVQPGNFAPLQKTTQEMKLENVGRKEQDFKWSSKKEQEERRKVREAKEAQEVTVKK